MEKHKQLIVSSFLVAAALCVVWIRGDFGKRPFAALEAGQVESVTLSVFPPDQTLEITDRGRIEEIVDALRQVVLYQKDDSGRDYDGQLVQYTLHFNDQTEVEAGAYNPFFYYDNICYRAKHEPCEELNRLGNKTLRGE